MSKRKMGVGYIGTGQTGQFLDGGPYNGVAWRHAKIAGACDEAAIVAASSRKQENVDAFCKEFDVPKGFTDYREMLQLPELDIVVVCTPSGTHSDIIVQAAQAGKHVLVEKPLDVTLPKIDAAIAACREAGVKLQVGFNKRFTSGIQPLKQALDAGRLGKMVLVHATCQRQRLPEYFTDSTWRGTWAGDGGGVLMNQGCHMIDLMLYLCGDVATVAAATAELNHPMIEVEDTAAALLKFRNGALGAMTMTTAACPDIGDTLTINGTEGVIKLGNPATCWTGSEAPPGLDEKLPHNDKEYMLRDLIGAIREDRPPLCSGEEGRRSIALIRACYDSQEMGGKAVALG